MVGVHGLAGTKAAERDGWAGVLQGMEPGGCCYC